MPAVSYALTTNGLTTPHVIALVPGPTPGMVEESGLRCNPTIIELPVNGAIQINEANFNMHRCAAVPAQPTVARAHLVTPDLEADCERMTHQGDVIVLEGNVRLVSKKNGSVIRIEAPRVVLNMKTGGFNVESNVRPVSPSGNVIWRGAVVPELQIPAAPCIIYAEVPSNTFQPPIYRMIQTLQVPVLELLLQPPSVETNAPRDDYIDSGRGRF